MPDIEDQMKDDLPYDVFSAKAIPPRKHVGVATLSALARAAGPDPRNLRRHDYFLEVAGGVPVAQYVHDIIEIEGFRFPTRRRAYVRGPRLKAIRDLLLISLDLSDFRTTRAHE